MYRISYVKATNKLIEIQGNGWSEDAQYRKEQLEVLELNAIAMGYLKNDIKVEFISDEEALIWFIQINAQNAAIPRDKTPQELINENFESRIAALEAE